MLHDLDSPRTIRQDKLIVNPICTINERIYSETLKGGKAYNAIKELMDEKNDCIKSELRSIMNSTIPKDFSRIVLTSDTYRELAKEYRNCITEELDKWKFPDES